MGVALDKIAWEDPSFRVQGRRGDGPDAHLRDGRAAPGDHRGPPARGSSTWAPTSASRRWPTRRRSARPSEPRGKFIRQTGGPRPVRPCVARGRAQRAGQGLRVRGQDHRRCGAPGVHPGGREGHQGGDGARGCWPATPSSMSRCAVVDGSYHEVDSSEMAFKIAASMAIQERGQEGPPGPARAHHVRRGRRSQRSTWAT